MIPKVSRGGRAGGLMTYLAGAGRHNEHTDPQLVAGSAEMMAWYSTAELDRQDALAVAKFLDAPRQAFDVEVPTPIYDYVPVGRQADGTWRRERRKVGESSGHIWHCSLSLHADEGLLSDDKWEAIATEFVEQMGFDDNDGTKAPCRWVAVRHGTSRAGNDHVHLAVQLVREDGTKASVHNDFIRAQRACRELEAKYGLEQLESRDKHRSARGWKAGERESEARRRAAAAHNQQADRSGGQIPAWEQLDAAARQRQTRAHMRPEQPTRALERTVRAAMTAAGDEAEFVRRMRRGGLLVRPYYAKGATDVITGYTVAARPAHGQRPIWYGGGRLAHDLSLPRIRAHRSDWPDTPQHATGAAAEWNAAARNRRPVSVGAEMSEHDPALWDEYAKSITTLREQLRRVPLEDHDTWAAVARDSAGAFAAWSQRVEEQPGPLADTAAALSRSAHLKQGPQQPVKAHRVGLAGAAMMLAAVSTGGRGKQAQAMMLRQLVQTMRALHSMHKAAGDARQAAALAALNNNQLRELSQSLPKPGALQPATASVGPQTAEQITKQQGPLRPQAPGSAVPSKMEPAPKRATPARGRASGLER